MVYLLLGLPALAAIPFAYQVIAIVGLAVFARSGDFGFLRFSQLGAMLILPFVLQWTLGGFVNGSAVMVWAFVSPLAALVLYPPRKAIWFFVGYLGLTLFSAAIDPFLSARAPEIPDWVQLTFFVLNISLLSTVTYVVLQYFVATREQAQAQAERLLSNVLPDPIAERLRAGNNRSLTTTGAVTVLFADVAGFTPFARRAGAERVITSSTTSSRASTSWPRATASRRSRPSATRTWRWPARPSPGPTMRRGRRHGARDARRVPGSGRRGRRAIAMRIGHAHGQSWPASSAGASSPTTCGATP